MTMPAPRVSVVMPVYRVERYVGASVRSVLQQSWRDFELVVVDDASPDRSIDIVRAFDDPRIRIVRHERNLGLSAARNTGLDAARADCVALLDSDDVAPPHRLARQLRLLEAQPRLVGCGAAMRRMDADGRLGRRHTPPSDPELLRATLLFHNTFFVSSLLMRTRVARAVRYRTDFRMAEDYEFNTRAASIGPIANLPDVLLHYRVHGHSLTATQPARMAECVQRVCAAQLQALGVTPLPRDATLHHHVGHLDGAPSLPLLDDAHAWLLMLQQRNRAARVYDAAAFERVLSMRWFEVCTHAAQLGPRMLERYRGSPLCAAWRPPAPRFAKFAVKCLLRLSLRAAPAPTGRPV
jgi:hypothetical protein